MERYRISGEVGLYFVTMSVVDWLPVFVSEQTCRVLTESLNFCHDRKGLRINAYVIMPTHFHAIGFLRTFDPTALKATLVDLRKFTGRRLSEHCARFMPSCFTEVFAAAAGNDRDRRFWQPTMHPELIETEPFYLQKRDYLHDNPCRKGLVARPEYWRFSSASYWLSEGGAPNDVLLSQIEW
jgi:REP element-mobilizing transposase RayT